MINKPLLFKFTFLLAVIVVSYLVFSKPSYPQNIPGMDKVGHVGSFFGLTLLAYFAFRPRWYLVFIATACYGALIEVVQSYLPYRSADYHDFIADMCGVVLFYLLLFLSRLCYKTWNRSSR
ncbi:VanZ family protein [Shewanella mangrovi]|uniref:VanZ family protein n=1 Tax=Shewanella mangrovi TaxID=1515746 RepID=UPI0005646BE1